jgi:hypothetical protein
MSRPLTAEEKALQKATKTAEAKDAVRIAECLKWEDVNSNKTVFLLDVIPPEKAWTVLKLRKGATLHQIYRSFYTDAIINRLGAGLNRADFVMGVRHTELKSNDGSKRQRTVTNRFMNVTKQYILQSKAVAIYLTANQDTAKQSTQNQYFMKTKIQEARQFFDNLTGITPTGRENIEKIISTILFTKEFTDEISQNFQNLVLYLGQYIAGDEKLFFFSGNSGYVRLCISKPDRVGLWFYELCGRLQVGEKELPYLLDFLMHDSLRERVTTTAVVKRWHAVVMTIGKEMVPAGENPNPHTYLAMDSYYECDESRAYLLEVKQKFTASCSPDRVKLEKYRVHKDHPTNTPGDTRSIWNSETQELFTYHWDTQKGVGEKYNLSYGFKPSQLRRDVQRYKQIIPGYGWYQQFFEACDDFNAGLHDRTWPHKRGGRGVSGDLGRHNDFIDAAMLQNTYNAYLAINDILPSELTFQNAMIELASDLYRESIALVDNIRYV